MSGNDNVVLAAHAWPTNAHMIADVARLGYLDGVVFDATYGEGGFWTVWKPDMLITNDLYKPAQFSWDYKRIERPDSYFATVVLDAPYKLSGTPASPDMDDRFGTEEYVSRAERMEDIRLGAIECYRVCCKYLLVKVMNQTEGGRKRWQTDLVTTAIEGEGGRKVDEFHLINPNGGRPQPGGRKQRTARANYSTLLVFEKPRLARPVDTR